jgi:hypothetical protein
MPPGGYTLRPAGSVVERTAHKRQVEGSIPGACVRLRHRLSKVNINGFSRNLFSSATLELLALLITEGRHYRVQKKVQF